MLHFGVWLKKAAMEITNFLTLPDGRRLAYAEFGDPNGHPVLYFHGAPSSRLEPLIVGNEAISQRGVRLIAPDRPGVGQSDFQPNRGFSDWVNDVVFLADALKLDKFSILGISGGCGYVAACAAKIPERLHAAVIVSGAWRMDLNEDLPIVSRFMWFLAKRTPILYQGWLQLLVQSLKGSPEKLLTRFEKQFPPADYAVLKQPGCLKLFCDTSIEAVCKGAKGTAYDVQLYAHEWDFSLEEIQIPLIWFHGEQDRNVPIALIKQVTASLPTIQFIPCPQEGHISLIMNQFEPIAKVLVGEAG
jgi:pimeloyl-ACP methyl ester carboxylesterase